ncbi:Inner membrane protein YjgN [Hartmannibacter diazotrophicus]|uniref:Inner membrane protein YjgN n=1 Tax=Hartmannibacter diazotrophicus TaxID=1482074 RepID=A0A2C9DEB6_9HYPH|nr:YjgN family protein [Hartmannibacter diazotrophicus]SON58195.1 Inner membrane protein YjgN [Hartmannibacter diazotrophicus]
MQVPSVPRSQFEGRAWSRATFTGRADEYFGIWIVNVILSILTLGIYSAWAKVRRKRYFLGNTYILGRRFDYHATGPQILKGRLIVFGVFVLYNIAASIAPPLAVVIGLAVIAAVPILILRSLRFNARVTSYRNIRFDFVGENVGAYKAFMLGPIVSLVSLGLLAPVASHWAQTYIVNNLRYGDRAFRTTPSLGRFYAAFVPPLLIVVGSAVLAFFLINASRIQIISSNGESSSVHGTAAVVAVYGFLLAFVLAGLLFRVAVHNIVWTAMTYDEKHAFQADIPQRRYVWVALSNLVVTLCTLGLMRPWAAVRESRLVASHCAIAPDGEIDDVIAQAKPAGAAVGSEFVALEGIDLGI